MFNVLSVSSVWKVLMRRSCCTKSSWRSNIFPLKDKRLVVFFVLDFCNPARFHVKSRNATGRGFRLFVIWLPFFDAIIRIGWLVILLQTTAAQQSFGSPSSFSSGFIS